MTDFVATQLPVEIWKTDEAALQVTQHAVEIWRSVESVTTTFVVSSIVVEIWQSNVKPPASTLSIDETHGKHFQFIVKGKAPKSLLQSQPRHSLALDTGSFAVTGITITPGFQQVQPIFKLSTALGGGRFFVGTTGATLTKKITGTVWMPFIELLESKDVRRRY